jgi:hypothetical protein
MRENEWKYHRTGLRVAEFYQAGPGLYLSKTRLKLFGVQRHLFFACPYSGQGIPSQIISLGYSKLSVILF